MSLGSPTQALSMLVSVTDDVVVSHACVCYVGCCVSDTCYLCVGFCAVNRTSVHLELLSLEYTPASTGIPVAVSGFGASRPSYVVWLDSSATVTLTASWMCGGCVVEFDNGGGVATSGVASSAFSLPAAGSLLEVHVTMTASGAMLQSSRVYSVTFVRGTARLIWSAFIYYSFGLLCV